MTRRKTCPRCQQQYPRRLRREPEKTSDPWWPSVATWVRGMRPGEEFTIAEALKTAVGVATLTRAAETRIGKILRALPTTKVRRRQGQDGGRVWMYIRDPELASSEPLEPPNVELAPASLELVRATAAGLAEEVGCAAEHLEGRLVELLARVKRETSPGESST